MRRITVAVPVVAVVLIAAGLTVGVTSLVRTRDQAQAATAQVVRPFRLLAAGAGPGLSKAQYSALVRHAQAAYDAYRPASERDLKVVEALAAALRHYHSALTWWELSIRYHGDHEAEVHDELARGGSDVRAALEALGR